jgi:hypothetical protein
LDLPLMPPKAGEYRGMPPKTAACQPDVIVKRRTVPFLAPWTIVAVGSARWLAADSVDGTGLAGNRK